MTYYKIILIIIILCLSTYIIYKNITELFQSPVTTVATVEQKNEKSNCLQFVENAEKGKYDKQYLKCYEDCIYTKPSKDSKIYCGIGSECDAFCDDVTNVN